MFQNINTALHDATHSRCVMAVKVESCVYFALLLYLYKLNLRKSAFNILLFTA